MSLKVSFPLYCVASSDALGGVVVAGGGGGTSKVGIPNAITVMSWDEASSSLVAALTYDKIDDVVRNIAVSAPNPDKLLIAFGHGNHCTLATLTKDKKDGKFSLSVNKTSEVVKRRHTTKEDNEDDEEDNEQTSVAFVNGARSTECGIACGLSTGTIKIFDYDFKLSQEVATCDNDCGAVYSIDCTKLHVLATYYDGKVRRWRRIANSLTVEEKCEFVSGPTENGFSVPVKPPPPPKFGSPSTKKPTFKYAKFVPEKKEKKTKANSKSTDDCCCCCCYVVAGMLSCGSWVAAAVEANNNNNSKDNDNNKKVIQKKAVVATSTTTSRHTSLAVSDKHVAIATVDGSVVVHENRLPKAIPRLCTLKKVHNFVATGVAFTPCGASHVVSVGLDNRVCVSEIRGSGPQVFSLIFVFLIACAAVVFGYLYYGGQLKIAA